MSNYKKMATLLSSSAIVVVGGAVAAEDTDWSGPYAGGTFTKAVPDGPPAYDIFAGGGFVGNNWTMGNGAVFGAEFAMYGPFAVGPSAYEGLTDAKVRAGFAFGDALIYGVGGYSSGSWVTPDDPGTYTYPVSGFNYGVGIDYAINDNAFVGLEYLWRGMTDALGEYDPGAIRFNSLSMRMGVNF